MNQQRYGTSLPLMITATPRPARTPALKSTYSSVSMLCAGRTLLLCAALVLSGTVCAQALDHAAYRTSLVDLMGVIRDVHARAGNDAPGSRVQIDLAAQLFGEIGTREIDALSVTLPEARLREIVTQARSALDQAPASRGKTVIVAQPNVTPAFCSDYPPPVVLAALTTKHVAQHVIDAMEYACQESIPPGINNALTCEGPQIASAAADIASDLADFCGNQGSAATNDAVLFTERSIGLHLNTQLDAVLSTRATQASADTANTTATSNDDLAEDIQTKLDQDFAEVEQQIADAVDALSDIADDITGIQAVTDDIAFRVQISQLNVEDAQDRSADLQAKASELITSLACSRSVSAAAAGIAQTLAPSIEAAARQQRRDDLGAALGDANARISGFALPVASGGRIEEAREVLIAAILALQTLGQDTAPPALTLLAAGDQDYNAGRYADAWRKFAQAYRLLDPHATALNEAAP